jgi:hypothetical protein
VFHPGSHGRPSSVRGRVNAATQSSTTTRASARPRSLSNRPMRNFPRQPLPHSPSCRHQSQSRSAARRAADTQDRSRASDVHPTEDHASTKALDHGVEGSSLLKRERVESAPRNGPAEACRSSRSSTPRRTRAVRRPSERTSLHWRGPSAASRLDASAVLGCSQGLSPLSFIARRLFSNRVRTSGAMN